MKYVSNNLQSLLRNIFEKNDANYNSRIKSNYLSVFCFALDLFREGGRQLFQEKEKQKMSTMIIQNLKYSLNNNNCR